MISVRYDATAAHLAVHTADRAVELFRVNSVEEVRRRLKKKEKKKEKKRAAKGMCTFGVPCA